MSTESEKRRLSLALGDEKDCYYVYALCDGEGNPFYIGKGKGARLWAHEGEAERFVESMASTDDLRNREEQRILKEKIDEIRRLGDEMKRVVVKWGLTEHEAFMAESSLINLCNYAGGRLTNIQGGHRSDREKLYIPQSQAWDVDGFLDEVAPVEKSLSDIAEPVLFVSLNKTYLKDRRLPKDQQLDAIMASARGCWASTGMGGVTEEVRSSARYLLGVFERRIVGVFKIENGSWHRKYEADESHPQREYARCARSLQREIEALRAEGVNADKIFDRLSPNNQQIFKDYLCEGVEAECRRRGWYNRWYCSCMCVDPSDPMYGFRNAVMGERVFSMRQVTRFYDPR